MIIILIHQLVFDSALSRDAQQPDARVERGRRRRRVHERARRRHDRPPRRRERAAAAAAAAAAAHAQL